MDPMRLGVFSPIRHNSSLERRESEEFNLGSISEFLKGPTSFKENLNDPVPRSKKETTSGDKTQSKIGKESLNKSKGAGKISSNRKRSSKLPLTPNINDPVFLISTRDSNNPPETANNAENVSKNNKSLPKTGKSDKTNQSKTKSSGVLDKTAASLVIKKNDKDFFSKNFVTVRNDRRETSQQSEGGESATNKQHTHKNSASVLETHLEKLDVPVTKATASSSRSLENLEKVIVGNCASQNDNYSSQLQPTITAPQYLAQKKNLVLKDEKITQPTAASEIPESKKNVNESCEQFSVNQRNQPDKIQCGIIEQFINNTVTFQFDGIRQQLYQQHMSLCKIMNLRLEEIEKQRAGENETLYKIIQELLEENRQLRSAILAHQ